MRNTCPFEGSKYRNQKVLGHLNAIIRINLEWPTKGAMQTASSLYSAYFRTTHDVHTRLFQAYLAGIIYVYINIFTYIYIWVQLCLPRLRPTKHTEPAT